MTSQSTAAKSRAAKSASARRSSQEADAALKAAAAAASAASGRSFMTPAEAAAAYAGDELNAARRAALKRTAAAAPQDKSAADAAETQAGAEAAAASAAKNLTSAEAASSAASASRRRPRRTAAKSSAKSAETASAVKRRTASKTAAADKSKAAADGAAAENAAKAPAAAKTSAQTEASAVSTVQPEAVKPPPAAAEAEAAPSEKAVPDSQAAELKPEEEVSGPEASAAESGGKGRQTGGGSGGGRLRRGLKLLRWTFLFLVILAGSLGTAFYLELKQLPDYAVPPRDEPYELTAGMRAGEVIEDLAGKEFNRAVIWAYVKLHAAELSKIQKGRYLIDGTLTVSEILRGMTMGDVWKQKPFTVALVEGMTYTQILKRLNGMADLKQDAESCFTDPGAFITETLTKEQLEFIGGSKETLEGLLMPATYPYFKDDSAKAIVARALRSMVIYLMQEWPKRDNQEILKSPYEALILASIVERESSLNAEQPLIAGVFYNRLRRGMLLQTDPAVMYGVSPDFRGPLKRSQLKADTPYNTYTREGLPPTPIAMPGKNALKAALHPAATKALYFVAKSYDPQDGHNFAETLREHNRNVAAYRRSVSEFKQGKAE